MSSPSSRLLSCFLAVTLAWGALACRTGGGPSAQAPGGPETPAFVQALLGQQRILLNGGEGRAISRRRGEGAPKPDVCDAAVEIRQATLQGDVLRLGVVYLGQPRLEGSPVRRGKPCGVVPETAVTLGGMDGTEAVASAEMGRVLQTPEDYLAASGVGFDKPKDVVEGVAATGTGTSTAPERNLARQVTAWPRRLLWVDTAVAAPKKRLRREGEVEVRGVVATDGRLTEPQVLTPLSNEHLAAVKSGLNLWRFLPARAGDKAIAARTSARLALRMY